jgi:STE24 endopeptidase
MASTFFHIMLGILTGTFLLERWLDWLNAQSWTQVLPDALKGIYDEEKYRKSQEYLKSKQRFSQVSDAFTFILMMGMLASGGFAFLDYAIRGITENPVLLALLFFGILGAASAILSLPFDVYAVFVLEERFGFNTTTPRTFVLDKFKEWVLAIVIGGGLVALITYLYMSTGNWFWLITWGVIALFMIFITMFYSTLIVPLFNRQVPLEQGHLRDAIESFAAKAGFRIDNIFVIDGSKRSRKANAYFAGLGSRKRIVLYDTLINEHDVPGIVAVLAHEIGHYRKKHTLVSILLALLQTGVMLFILSLFIRPNSQMAANLCQALGGFSGTPVMPGFHLGVLAFALLYSPLSLIFGLAVNALSRKHEFEADRYAGLNSDVVALGNALKKLSVDNLSNLRPHPVYVFFYYSHPPLLQRLEALKGLSSS